MGYFSQLAITLDEKVNRPAKGQSVRERLIFRIDELKDRLEDFSRAYERSGESTDYEVFSDRSLQKEELRFTLPKDLLRYDEVLSAMMLATEDLQAMDREAIDVTILLPGQIFFRPMFAR